MAILCELIPAAIPQLAFSAETIFEAKPMAGYYPKSKTWLGCEAPLDKGMFVVGCTFPGSRLYEIINDFSSRKFRAQKYIESDYDLNGWLSNVASDYSITSGTVVDVGILFPWPYPCLENTSKH